ncbi:MAG: cysteine desulfurase [Clostridia bacterium]|nr:cysteine desulfurase [Clostridia bacterium]
MKAYFDNSATTRPCETAVLMAQKAITEYWGNPSSLHQAGSDAAALLRKARKQVSSLLRVPEDNFFFTSSGTTANNTAIFGVCEKLRRQGNKIITTAIEHPSVGEPIKQLEASGFEIVRLMPDCTGKINEDELLSAIDKNTILISLMAVNNEVGSLLPVNTIRRAIKRADSPALIHSDCVQALSKILVSPKTVDADIITVSGHKIHALKGVGGIYLKTPNLIKPYILGGGQEKGLHSGTEATPAILSFGAAAEEAMDIKSHLDHVQKLRDKVVDGIKDIGCVTINSPENAIPYILNISILGLPSQPTVNFMSDKGIAISAGSACKMGHRSPVLTAMGLPPQVIDSAVRISFSRYNTEEEADMLISAIREAADKYGKKGT